MYMCATTHEVLYLKGVWEDEGTAPHSLPFALGGNYLSFYFYATVTSSPP